MITYNDVTEFEAHKFDTFASDIGLRAGQWPEKLETTMGNKQPLLMTNKKFSIGGDLEHVRYEQQFGCIALIVYND